MCLLQRDEMRSCVLPTLLQVGPELGDAGDTRALGVPLSPGHVGQHSAAWGCFGAGLIPTELLDGEERPSWHVPFTPML